MGGWVDAVGTLWEIRARGARLYKMDRDLIWIPKMQVKLLQWFEEHQRPLPWRKKPEPYHVLVSETMLQQTTVTSVIPYYHRFMERFPLFRLLLQPVNPMLLSIGLVLVTIAVHAIY